MIGAVLGDIAGSKWEFQSVNSYYKDSMKLFQFDSFFTDDTVLAAATKWAILNDCPYADAYRMFYNYYPDCSYGGRFISWVLSDNPRPYNSCGNGSAMRVGYVGEHFASEEKVIEEAIKSAECTHNHPEGIKGAVTTALCTFYARQGKSREFIRSYIEQEAKYSLASSMQALREQTKNDFCDETCQGAMPVALLCFLLSHDYESCLRNVLSVNCDTDTCACIAGGIAKNFYGRTGFRDKRILRRYIDDRKLFNLIFQ